ncbi:MAG: glutamate-5-semialdehyde dehydrogenase [Nitrospinota bacterium]|nr:glutamate-5-semialdehyde dehydrogenase [Nitrospinota bacterium]HJP19045.1 glutamate-5-semialdehyde dehydrogenase [Nitrospinota bacterium]
MIEEKIKQIAQDAKAASRKMGGINTKIKNDALLKMADDLIANTDELVKANSKDLEFAKQKGLTSAMQERLMLNKERIEKMADSLREVVLLTDPVSEIVKMWRLPNGLQVGKIRTPIGVIGIIYESRPNVTVDAASLCLKSGNAVVLRGGSESIHSNIALAKVLTKTAKESGLPEKALQLVDITDRSAVHELLKMDEYIDLIIPRGGHALIRTVVENSSIPVIKHDKGLCHVYIDSKADLKMGEEIAFNAKTQRPSVCNAMETLLVHKDVAEKFLPSMISRFIKAGVEIRGCAKTKKIAGDIKEASTDDWDTEYLDLILSIKVVESLDAAIDHITLYGSMLSEAIVTTDYNRSWKFLREVDASAVYVNASTRFTDGNEFGLGAEMGISTQKLHCRGPMGLEELTSTKYIIFGDGQIKK